MSSHDLEQLRFEKQSILAGQLVKAFREQMPYGWTVEVRFEEGDKVQIILEDGPDPRTANGLRYADTEAFFHLMRIPPERFAQMLIDEFRFRVTAQEKRGA